MSSPSPTPEDGDSATAGVHLASVIGGVTLIISLIVFEILRRYVPTVFEFRQALRDRGEKKGHRGESIGVPDPPSKVPIYGWISSTLQQTPEKLEITHGLDAAFFSRYLRSKGLLHLLLTVICCTVLLPVYWTAGNKSLPEDDALRTQGFQVVSMGNIPTDNSWRFYVAFSIYVLSAILTVVVTLLDYQAFDKARRRFRASSSPSNFAVLFQDIPADIATEEKIHAFWEDLFPGKVEYVHLALNAKKLVKKRARWLNAVTRRERAEWDFFNNPKLAGARPTHKLGALGCCKGNDSIVDSINYWQEQSLHYEQKISQYQKEKPQKHVPALRAAMVVFKTKRAASIAVQVLFARKDSEWRAMHGPSPEAVNWPSLSISHETTDIRRAITFTLIILMTLFWSVITIAVQGLANLSKLAAIKMENGNEPFRFLDTIAGASPQVKAFVEGVLPSIVQSVLISLVPVFITIFVSISRYPSMARLQAVVRNWLSFFLFFNGFLFVVLGGAFIQSLKDLVKVVNPPDIKAMADLLAKAVPSQGTFFMTFVVVQSLSDNMMQHMQLARVALRWIFRKLLCRTPRQLNSKDFGGSIFLYFRYYAFAQLISIISLTYAAIQPVIIPCCLCYYLTAYFVFTYQIAYTSVQPFDAAGEMFPGAVGSTFVGLVLQSIVMAGLFGLNKQATLSTLSLIFTGVILIPYFYMRRRFPRVTEHGSLVETALADAEKGGEERIAPSVARLYRHPGMVPVPDPVEDLSGLTAEQRSTISTEGATAAKTAASIDTASPGSNDIENAFEAGAVESVAATAVAGPELTESKAEAAVVGPELIELESVYLDARGDSSNGGG